MAQNNKMVPVLQRLFLISLLFAAELRAQSFEDLLNEFSQDVDSLDNEFTPSPSEDASSAPLSLPSASPPHDEVSLEAPEDDFKTGKMTQTNGIVLQGLDKQTARVYFIEAAIGKVIEFGTLRILVNRCLQSSPEDQPESTAFVVISEARTEAEPQVLFSGWMFASSPAISALDHPVYDVWVKGCKALDAQK